MQEICFECVKIYIHHKESLILCPVSHYETVGKHMNFGRPLLFYNVMVFCKNTFNYFENEERNSHTHV